ncbi:LysR family transcriptional regulator [Conexibacter sp. JD483]|uniref:LysR family transcriptional regulator n=1 Tax=unclassified Conexibacter TaxID=2627773 RepID=UPI00271B6726|nr:MULTISPECIES: LysR family transcriptional regulator [unclassified Conexibacter]MDO8184926.1 LysR family transcriptional regulator [Conexibacter sp. CPCC 205706]MDO8198070.1 LysR family transcriptional regulator [Conexibacter sp. CPCC 205762]MDR9371359.1 LysR family transcriptional regulator [Conexibacter sp. JD483]
MGELTANPLPSADLAAFVAAFEAGTMRGAADTLELTQSAVTKRVAALERRTGATLLERGRFGVRPTGAGRVLYPEAKRVLAALRDAEEALASHQRDGGPSLALAASHTVGEFLLPDWLARFRGELPTVHAQVDIVNSAGVIAALRERRAQIGFVEGRDPLGSLEPLVVHRDEIAVVVSTAHRWARRRSLRAAELRGQPYVAREAGSGTRMVATAALAEQDVALEPLLELASAESVKRALAAGGFALLSRLAVDAEQRNGTLRTVPLRDVPLARELRAVRDPRRALPRQAERFWSWLATTLAPQA